MTDDRAIGEPRGTVSGSERFAQIAASLQKRVAVGGRRVQIGVFASNDVRANAPKAAPRMRCIGWRPLVVGAA
jgi:hypothetical protein